MVIKSEALKLSASAIKTYKQCPRKYYFTYIEKLPKKTWPHTELGNFVHKSLELFHINIKDKPLAPSEWPNALQDCCKQAIKAHALTPEQKINAKGMLKTYLSNLVESGLPNVLSNEKKFEISLKDNIIIRGFIDRVDRDSDKDFHIVDYKTGKSKYLDAFQLLVYALAIFNEYPNLDRIKCSYIVLSEGSKVIPYNFTKTDVERVVNDIVQTGEQIRTDKTWETRPQMLCAYCDFEAACPATQQTKDMWGSYSKSIGE